MPVELSVIIPTHKRAPILAHCLEHLEKQTIAHSIEVIVVSDGEDVKTEQLFANRTWQIPVQFLVTEKSQQGVARNRGLALAKSELTLFIGDDIFLAPDACEIHVKTHRKFEITRHPEPGRRTTVDIKMAVAVLGHITWDPAAGITPVMTWLESSGWQFGYGQIAAYAHSNLPCAIQHKFTYASFVSLPTAIARAHPFRDDVTAYGWEDIEWGLRLKKATIPLIYEPDAKALHHHHMNLADSLKRMEAIGKSAKVFEQIAPELDLVPKWKRRLRYEWMALLPTMRGKHCHAFLQGIAASK